MFSFCVWRNNIIRVHMGPKLVEGEEIMGCWVQILDDCSPSVGIFISEAAFNNFVDV